MECVYLGSGSHWAWGSECPEGYYDVTLVEDYYTGEWWIGDAVCNPSCVAEETPTPTPEPPDWHDIPDECEPGTSPWSLDCDWEGWQVRAAVELPAQQVSRKPYPWGLVSLENVFWIVGPEMSEEVWSDKALPEDNAPGGTCSSEGQVRNIQVGVRWRRLNWNGEWDSPADVLGEPEGIEEGAFWDFDEREWNLDLHPGTGKGYMVTHIYETSSWGKPRNGPPYLGHEDEGWTAPAYQVVVKTPWVAEWALQYDRCECVETERVCVECSEEEVEQGTCPNWCGGPNADGWKEVERCKRREWVHHFEGWYWVDLRDFSNPTWYAENTKVQSVGERWNGHDFDREVGPVMNALPVPVGEVQSILTTPW